EMPQHFLRFLNFLDVAASRDQVLAQTFGGGKVVSQPFLAEWKHMVSDIHSALAGNGSRLVLVTTPELFALNESLRVREQLASETGLQISEVVLNRAVLEKSKCACCSRTASHTRSAAALIKKRFAPVQLLLAQDTGTPILGVKKLQRFAEHV